MIRKQFIRYLLFGVFIALPWGITQSENKRKTPLSKNKTETPQGADNLSSFSRKTISDSIISKDLNEQGEDALLDLLLPPIEVFFEAAKNSPIVEYYRSRTTEESYALRSVNNSWMNFIRLTGGYQYGSMGIISTLDASNSLLHQSSTNNQSYYNIGVSIILPLETFVDLSNKSKRQKQNIIQTQLETERYYNEQKLLISESYTNAVRTFNLIRVRSEALQLAEAQYRVSIEEFVANKISASDLSRMKNIHSSAKGDYELTRAELINSLLRLEILSGYKILNMEEGKSPQ